MKRIIFAILVLMLVISGCSNAKDENNGTSEPQVSSEANAIEQEVSKKTQTGENASNDKSEEEAVQIKVIMPYGTPTLSMIKMVTENPVISENVTIEYEMIESTDVLTTTLINEEADIAIVPTNMAAVLYNKGIGYKMAGVSVWGILYVISSEDIQSIEDLKGKSISTIGRNMTPDAMLRFVLTQNGINPDEDLTLEYFSGASELATHYISGEGNLSIAPEPVLTSMLMKRQDSKVVLDLQEEWKKVTGMDNYPQVSIIVSEKLANESPEVVKAFLETYSEGIDWVNANPTDAGKYYEALDIGLKAPVVAKAIPGCNMKFLGVDETKEVIETYLKVLFEFNPQLLGGKMIDSGIYFEK
ncbi:ABC transporter substrate-binding protein [Fusibacter sp. 3D3]|uniref:ABC transporter substrate-binding protein n=1 Tax=Fusibacter sp. 3D3 TaxID=1048380 RepID=UPI000852B3C6|nr:ABC transporter substrate-binding protein [Fusibacter sp. 3D3]GAU78869.1 ABC-type nitrate/sulfonate/bicarbonate transport systems periplasmic components [Fusibacter sp. 3D3]